MGITGDFSGLERLAKQAAYIAADIGREARRTVADACNKRLRVVQAKPVEEGVVIPARPMRSAFLAKSIEADVNAAIADAVARGGSR